LASSPKGYSSVADQLKRASISIVLNIGEAAGKPTPGENRKHFGIARGSALECAAALDTLKVLGVGEVAVIHRGKGLLVETVAMLTKLCR
jgi:four helix bundle protein